ncbi:MAG: lipid-A-disaccharide synthase [Ottowia sp.]|nr:lipid-A-disaccharide synthase [Ottowia sp.]
MIDAPALCVADDAVGANRFAFVAGEPSGDLLASFLLKALHARLPASCFGIGGPLMVEQGFTAHWSMYKLAVRGYVEALRHIPEILKIRRALRAYLLAHKPCAFIGVDAPDFNLSLECDLRAAGIPTLHFVSPSIWAWRAGRIKKIARAVDHMLCVFPFEKAIYDQAGIPATYVGHPLAEQIPTEIDMSAARRRFGLNDHDLVLAVLPGSRHSEINLLAPTFFAAMQRIKQAEPTMRFIVPIATPELTRPLQLLHARYPELDVILCHGQAQSAMAAANVVLLASGTATLEAALYKKPMVIAYKVPWLTAQVMKRQALLPYVGLPNIIAGRCVVPELLQEAATPEALCAEVLKLFADVNGQARLTDIFHAMHLSLRRDTANLAADVVINVMRQYGRI